MKEKTASLSKKAIIYSTTLATVSAFVADAILNRDIDKEALAQIKNREEIELVITDHTPDLTEISKGTMDGLYKSVEELGFEGVRFDLRWRLIEPQKGGFDSAHLRQYQEAIIENSEQKELNDPILILGDAPSWAKELYKSNKEAFYSSFEVYATKSRDAISSLPGKKISHIQLFNELNHPFYNFISVEDLPRLADLVRSVFKKYNPDIKIFSTVIASNLLGKGGYGEGVMEYLARLEPIKDTFDGIGVDYYPATWNIKLDRWKNPENIGRDLFTKWAVIMPFPEVIKDAVLDWDKKDILKDNFSDLDLLEKALREIASWGKESYIMEIGFPSDVIGLDEDLQKLFYLTFFYNLDLLFRKLEEEGIALPVKVGIYQLRDEVQRGAMAWALRFLNLTPMESWGLGKSDGEPKEVIEDRVIQEIIGKF